MPGGRPPAFEIDRDRQLEHAIFDLVAAGVPLIVAGRELGIPQRTLLRWVQRGRAGMARYERFLDGVEQARVERDSEIAQLVAAAQARTGRGNPQPGMRTGGAAV